MVIAARLLSQVWHATVSANSLLKKIWIKKKNKCTTLNCVPSSRFWQPQRTNNLLTKSTYTYDLCRKAYNSCRGRVSAPPVRHLSKRTRCSFRLLPQLKAFTGNRRTFALPRTWPCNQTPWPAPRSRQGDALFVCMVPRCRTCVSTVSCSTPSSCIPTVPNTCASIFVIRE